MSNLNIKAFCCLLIILLSASVTYAANKTDVVGEKTKNSITETPKLNNKDEVNLFIFEDKITNILREISRHRGIVIKISDKVKGYIRKRRLSGTFKATLNELSSDHDFEWFLYEKTLYVSNKSEKQTHFPKLGKLSYDQVIKSIRSSGLELDRFQIKLLDDKNSIILSGPPSYVAIVETIIETLQFPGKDAKKRIAQKIPTVLIYKGSKLYRVRLGKNQRETEEIKTKEIKNKEIKNKEIKSE